VKNKLYKPDALIGITNGGLIFADILVQGFAAQGDCRAPPSFRSGPIDIPGS